MRRLVAARTYVFVFSEKIITRCRARLAISSWKTFWTPSGFRLRYQFKIQQG